MGKSIDQIKAMGATNINMDVNPDNGIVSVFFTLNGVRIVAQFDSDNTGIYGITVPSLQGLAKLITTETEAIK